MKSEDILKAKIIILHIVSDVPGITYHMLMDKCMDSLFMDFFTFTQCYNELIAGNMLQKVIEDDGTGDSTAQASDEILTITSGGGAILEDLKSTINISLLKFLEEAKTSLTQELKVYNKYKAFLEYVDDSYQAILIINEDGKEIYKSIIKCKNQEEAKKYCNNWRKKAPTIHKLFLENLE